MNSCEDKVILFGQCVSPDAYVQIIGSFLGAIIGAVLAAVVAILVFKLQQEMDKKKQRIHELGMFSKCYHSICLTTLAALEDEKIIMESLKRISQLPDGVAKDGIKSVVHMSCSRIEGSLKLLQSFDYSYIPHGDLFLWYRNINQCLASFLRIAENQVDRNVPNLESLERLMGLLNDSLQKFSKLGIEKEKELSRLTNGKEMSYLLDNRKDAKAEELS